MLKEAQTLDLNKTTAQNMKQIIIKFWKTILLGQLVQPTVTNLNLTKQEAIIMHNRKNHRLFLIF